MGREKERNKRRRKSARAFLFLEKPPKMTAEMTRMIPMLKRIERVPIQEMR
jgi:hypothetical protein